MRRGVGSVAVVRAIDAVEEQPLCIYWR
jgi:hypothetical protein